MISLNIRITDSRGAYSDSPLSINILSWETILLNHIEDVIFVNKESKYFSYTDILKLQSQYDLNSNISIVLINKDNLPSYISETSSPFNCSINYNPYLDQINYLLLKFKVSDSCGNEYYTNEFKVMNDS